MTADIREAVRISKDAAQRKQPLSIGLLANAAEALPRMVDMGFIPDVVTDQTSAHDELNGYVPSGIPYEEALELRKSNPDLYIGYGPEFNGRSLPGYSGYAAAGRRRFRLRK